MGSAVRENPQKNMPSVHQLWGLDFPMIRFRDEEDQFLLRSDLSLHTFTEWHLGQRNLNVDLFAFKSPTLRVIRVGHSTKMTLALEGMFCWSNLRNLAKELATGLISMLYVYIVYIYTRAKQSYDICIFIYICIYDHSAVCVYIYMMMKTLNILSISIHRERESEPSSVSIICQGYQTSVSWSWEIWEKSKKGWVTWMDTIHNEWIPCWLAMIFHGI